MWRSIKQWFALWCLRRALTGFHVEHAKFDDMRLMAWFMNCPPLELPEPPSPFQKNYIQVEPAGDRKEVTDQDRLVVLVQALNGQLNFEEALAIYKKCNADFVKTRNVIRLMTLTFNTDEAVMSQYDTLMQQFGHKLK